MTPGGIAATRCRPKPTGWSRPSTKRSPRPRELPGQSALVDALEVFRGLFDVERGGFGGAPKFPQEPVLEFLLRVGDQPWADGALDMAHSTLMKMAQGGIFDHVGGGFARYAVDRNWLIPHFEKMLYTNAQLARLYLRAGQMTDEAAVPGSCHRHA